MRVSDVHSPTHTHTSLFCPVTFSCWLQKAIYIYVTNIKGIHHTLLHAKDLPPDVVVVRLRSIYMSFYRQYLHANHTLVCTHKQSTTMLSSAHAIDRTYIPTYIHYILYAAVVCFTLELNNKKKHTHTQRKIIVIYTPRMYRDESFY